MKERNVIMKNLRNFGVVTGRLSKGLTVNNNRDGSRKIRLIIAAQDNYVDRDGKRNSQFIELEAFIPASQETNGAYEYLDCGDMVSVGYSVRNNNYKDKNGRAVYSQVLMAEEAILLESRASKEARIAAKEAAS